MTTSEINLPATSMTGDPGRDSFSSVNLMIQSESEIAVAIATPFCLREMI
jgi:hypothetical protein